MTQGEEGGTGDDPQSPRLPGSSQRKAEATSTSMTVLASGNSIMAKGRTGRNNNGMRKFRCKRRRSPLSSSSSSFSSTSSQSATKAVLVATEHKGGSNEDHDEDNHDESSTMTTASLSSFCGCPSSSFSAAAANPSSPPSSRVSSLLPCLQLLENAWEDKKKKNSKMKTATHRRRNNRRITSPHSFFFFFFSSLPSIRLRLSIFICVIAILALHHCVIMPFPPVSALSHDETREKKQDPTGSIPTTTTTTTGRGPDQEHQTSLRTTSIKRRRSGGEIPLDIFQPGQQQGEEEEEGQDMQGNDSFKLNAENYGTPYTLENFYATGGDSESSSSSENDHINKDTDTDVDTDFDTDTEDGFTPRIVGGQDASDTKYPYFTRVDIGGFACGGSLIHPEWVLTAAHCNRGITDVVINATEPRGNGGPHAIDRRVDYTVPHPDYTYNRVPNYDFLLLKLDQPVYDVPLVKLDEAASPRADYDMTVIGLGNTEATGRVAMTLQEVVVQRISNEDCNDLYGGDGKVQANMICAAADGKDACRGDSGGPLIAGNLLNGDTSPDSHVQVGVVSWGYGCAHPYFPGVYGRISFVRQWIDDTICAESACNYGGGTGGGGGGEDSGGGGDPDVVEVRIKLDKYPGETSWMLDCPNVGLKREARIGAYNGLAFQTVSQKIDIPNGKRKVNCKFTISDTFGDGICCKHGNGFYEVVRNNDAVASGGEYGFGEDRIFETGGTGVSSPTKAPTNPPAEKRCEDDRSATFSGGKTCLWLSQQGNKRIGRYCEKGNIPNVCRATCKKC